MWEDLGGEAGVVVEAHEVLVVLFIVPRHPPLGGKAGFLSWQTRPLHAMWRDGPGRGGYARSVRLTSGLTEGQARLD